MTYEEFVETAQAEGWIYQAGWKDTTGIIEKVFEIAATVKNPDYRSFLDHINEERKKAGRLKDIGLYKECQIQADVAPTREGGPWSLSEVIINITKEGKKIRQQLSPPDVDSRIFNSEREAIAYALTHAKKWIDENLQFKNFHFS